MKDADMLAALLRSREASELEAGGSNFAWNQHRESLLDATSQAIGAARTVLELLDTVVEDLRGTTGSESEQGENRAPRPTSAHRPIPLTYDDTMEGGD